MNAPVSKGTAGPEASRLRDFVSGFSLQSSTMLLARALLVTIFLISGLSKLAAVDPTIGYMQAKGVPGALLYPTIVFETTAAVLILFGLKVRVTALLLAGFSLATGAIFHWDLGNPVQTIMFLKNVSMAGGFLLLAVAGGGAIRLDRRVLSQPRR